MPGRRRRWKWIALGVVVALLGAYNVLVYRHARALTHFTDGGPRTKRPQDMTRSEKLDALLSGARVPKPQNVATPASFGLTYSTHRFESAPGVELEAWRITHPSPRGVAVVFHGYAAAKAMQLAVAHQLDELGFESVLVDFRGSGGSSGFETTLGVEEANDVAASLAWVASHVSPEKPVVFGTSMGAAAILRAASKRRIEARAAILENPFGRMLDTVRARFALMGAPSWPSAELLVFWGGGLDGFAHDPVEFARDLRCPTLLLHGDADPTISVAQMREIHDNLPGKKELVLFPGAGHESFLWKHQSAWRAAVSRFVE